MATAKKNKITTEDFSFGPWRILARTGPILTSAEDERISSFLDLPALPEMCFGDTLLHINNTCGFGISFNAVDALKLVDNKHDKMKVAYATEWQGEREGVLGVTNEVAKPFDWTYTTDYRGTLTGNTPMVWTDTNERIDMEKLKRHERIHFYQDMILFEDELGDNGIAKMNVKIRVMPSSFFILLRFFLRVDDVLIRINDSRIFHEAGTDYILHEYSSKEKKFNELRNPHDMESIADQLDYVKQTFSKLQFPEMTNG